YAIEAEYVGGSETKDLAILRIKDSEILKNSSAREVKIANSDFFSIPLFSSGKWCKDKTFFLNHQIFLELFAIFFRFPQQRCPCFPFCECKYLTYFPIFQIF
ncbi:MAG: hypothetical protein II283_03125, partial [Alistipes sp.]|nr:hypothetical protein [Alistipes sp.]